MSKFSRFLLKLLAAAFSLFAVTFVVYFFNLDMKLTSKIEPLLLRHSDNIPRNAHL